jgi:hypothetical protein
MGGCGWLFRLFVVVYYGVEERVVNVWVYVVKVQVLLPEGKQNLNLNDIYASKYSDSDLVASALA